MKKRRVLILIGCIVLAALLFVAASAAEGDAGAAGPNVPVDCGVWARNP